MVECKWNDKDNNVGFWVEYSIVETYSAKVKIKLNLHVCITISRFIFHFLFHFFFSVFIFICYCMSLIRSIFFSLYGYFFTFLVSKTIMTNNVNVIRKLRENKISNNNKKRRRKTVNKSKIGVVDQLNQLNARYQ